MLVVMGLQAGLYVLESISLEFLERFMEKTMEKVNQELFFIFALLERVHPTLLEHLEKLVLSYPLRTYFKLFIFMFILSKLINIDSSILY